MSEENNNTNPPVDPDILGTSAPSFDMDFSEIEKPIETKAEVESTEETKQEIKEEKKNEESGIILESEIDKKSSDENDISEDEETEKEKNDRKKIENLSSELEKMYDEIVVLQEEINKESLDFSETPADDKDSFIIDRSNKNNNGKKNEKQKLLDEKVEAFKKKTEEYQHSISRFNTYGAEIEGSFGPSVSSENNVLKKIGSRKLKSNEFTKTIANDEENKNLFLSQYITMENQSESPVSGHRITRVPCLLSGYYAEIKTYTFAEMADFIRKANEPNKTFKLKFAEELDSLFSHIVWTSYQKKGEPLTLDEFLKKTKLPDLDQIYYGAYDASFPGTTSYNITCGSCGEEFPIEKTNKQLCYHLQNRGDTVLSDSFIHDILLQKKSVEELKNTKVYQIANTLYEDKVIYPNNIKVSYGTPSILDALETCAVIEDNYSNEFPDTSAIIDPRHKHYAILKLFASIKKLVLPVNAGTDERGRIIVKFYEVSTEDDDIDKRLEARKYIIKILNDLPEAQFSDLFDGKEVAKKVNIRGIQHLIPDVFCPNCKKYIGNIFLSMRTTFFMHTTEIVNGIVSVT